MYCLLTFAQCSELSVSAKVIWTVRLCIDLFMCACLFARLLKSDSKCVRAAQYEYLPCLHVCVCYDPINDELCPLINVLKYAIADDCGYSIDYEPRSGKGAADGVGDGTGA